MPPRVNKAKDNRRKPRTPREAPKARGCGEGFDYKDIEKLQKLVSQQGKLFSRKRSGLSAACQRSARLAVKRARFLALMPFVG